MPMSPSAMNGAGQPNFAVSQPANGEKIATAKYDADANSDVASPRSSFGNHMTATRPFAGKLGASIRPSAKRNANSSPSATDRSDVKLPMNPTSIVAIDHRISVAPYIFLVPRRSSSRPPGICPTTYAQLNADS